MLICYMQACVLYLTEQSAASEVTTESEALCVPGDKIEADEAPGKTVEPVVPVATGIQSDYIYLIV